jgi:hypothetical protein
MPRSGQGEEPMRRIYPWTVLTTLLTFFFLTCGAFGQGDDPFVKYRIEQWRMNWRAATMASMPTASDPANASPPVTPAIPATTPATPATPTPATPTPAPSAPPYGPGVPVPAPAPNPCPLCGQVLPPGVTLQIKDITIRYGLSGPSPAPVQPPQKLGQAAPPAGPPITLPMVAPNPPARWTGRE